MIAATIIFRNKDEGSLWPEISDALISDKAPMVGVLEGGMVSGKPSVAIRIDLPDGKIAIAQMTAAQFAVMGRAILAKYPHLLD